MMAQRAKQVLFVLLSIADLTLTCWLVRSSGGQAYEANPVAAWWLARHGAWGLACFKAAAVLGALGLTSLIARHRPRAAGGILTLGCASLAVVVVYSSALSWFVSPAEGSADWSEAALAQRLDAMNRDTQGRMRRREAFLAWRHSLCDDLIAGRTSLRDAVDRVVASETGRDPTWQRGLLLYDPQGSVPERVAVSLIFHVSRQAKGREAVDLLERELQQAYGRASSRLRELLPERGPKNSPVLPATPTRARLRPVAPAPGCERAGNGG
jgi:hypothetical protein